MVYYIPSPHPQIFFFVGTNNFCRILLLGAGKIFKYLGDLLNWARELNFLLGRSRARPFSSIKLSMTSHVNSRIVHGKIIKISFLTFTWEFSVWKFSVCSSVHSNISKKCLLLYGNNSVKVWILFNMSSEQVNTVW